MNRKWLDRKWLAFGMPFTISVFGDTANSGTVLGGNQVRANGKIHANVIPTGRKHHLQAEIRAHVAAKSAIYTDALTSYQGPNPDFAHKTINHAERYVEGQVHTNGLENFWSLVKRTERPVHCGRGITKRQGRGQRKAA